MPQPRPTTDVRSVEAWRPVRAPLTSSPGSRTAELTRAVWAQFDVEHNPRYAPSHRPDGGLDTRCNTYVWDGTLNLGCEVPHWEGEDELDANEVHAWLLRSPEWRVVGVDEACALASRGVPVLASAAVRGGHGHEGAVLAPRPGTCEVRVAAAGATCLFDVAWQKSFGHLLPSLFAHSES